MSSLLINQIIQRYSPLLPKRERDAFQAAFQRLEEAISTPLPPLECSRPHLMEGCEDGTYEDLLGQIEEAEEKRADAIRRASEVSIKWRKEKDRAEAAENRLRELEGRRVLEEPQENTENLQQRIRELEEMVQDPCVVCTICKSHRKTLPRRARKDCKSCRVCRHCSLRQAEKEGMPHPMAREGGRGGIRKR